MKRRYNYRRKLPHLQPGKEDFLHNVQHFQRLDTFDLARDLAMETCLRGDGHCFELHALVVMSDHIHFALTPRWDKRGTSSIPEITQEIKSVSAHRIGKETGRVGRVGQEESFDRARRREEDLDAKIQYMLNNSVRAGLVRTPAECRRIWIESTKSGRTGGAPVPPSRRAV
ncbi:MAG TPA: hypothetical protein VIX14_10965 [Terriglobales bacterium]